MILIVGGGIGGLSLAAALRRRGIAYELVEREPAWTTVGGGITLYPNGIRALRALGLADPVIASGAVVEIIRIATRHGEVVSEIPGESWPGHGPTVAIHRPTLQRLLVAAADEGPLRLGTTIASLSMRADGARVETSDGSAGHYEVVVGADGIGSNVRERCFGAQTARDVGQLYWRATISRPIVDRATMLFDEDRYLALMPLGAGRVYFAAQLRRHAPLPEAQGGARESLHAWFGDFGGPAKEAMAALGGDLHHGPAREIERDEWRAGRAVLLGDAAHACSPTLAQGGSLAIEDAVVLAELLERAGLASPGADPASIDRALDAFVARREPRARWVRERTHHQIALLNRGSPQTELAASLEATHAILREPI